MFWVKKNVINTTNNFWAFIHPWHKPAQNIFTFCFLLLKSENFSGSCTLRSIRHVFKMRSNLSKCVPWRLAFHMVCFINNKRDLTRLRMWFIHSCLQQPWKWNISSANEKASFDVVNMQELVQPSHNVGTFYSAGQTNCKWIEKTRKKCAK